MADYADRYRNLARRLTAVVDEVPASAWDNPSPCDGWSARDVLAHVVTTEWEFLHQVGLGAGGATLPDDPAEAWPQVRDRVQAVLDDPQLAGQAHDGFFGPTTVGALLDEFYACDLLVHAWDLARATGLAHHESMPPDEVERVLGDAARWGEAMRQPGMFGPAVEVDASSDARTRLLGIMGRQP